MNYAELAVMQASRAKTFSTAQTDAMTAYCQAEHDLKELQAENAKLRELVRDMRGYVESVCFECRSWEHFGHRGKPSECGNDECECKLIADRMKELGVDA